MNNEIEKIEEQPAAEEKVIPAKLHLLTRLVLTLASCVIAYLLTATHFLASVRAAHFLGDASYIPPSILRFTGILFRQGEVEAFAQILFFVVWLILVVVSCVVIFWGAVTAVYLLIGLFTDDKPVIEAIGDCFCSGIVCLAPVLALSLLTLLIMPLEGTHMASDSPSMSQIGELMSFQNFLFTMTQGTVVMFLVCFFVVITLAVAMLMDFIYPGGSFYFFCSIFVGVCVGIGVIMVLGHYLYAGTEMLNLKTGNAYLTHYALFGIYAVICTVLIMPSVLREEKKKPDETRKQELIAKQKKRNASKKNKFRQPAADAVVNQ